MTRQHCGAEAAVVTNHCEDHSGHVVWMRGIAALVSIAVALLSYSVFFQAPAIQTQLAKETARMDGRVDLVQKDISNLRTDYCDLRGRVEKLEK